MKTVNSSHVSGNGGRRIAAWAWIVSVQSSPLDAYSEGNYWRNPVGTKKPASNKRDLGSPSCLTQAGIWVYLFSARNEPKLSTRRRRVIYFVAFQLGGAPRSEDCQLCYKSAALVSALSSLEIDLRSAPSET